MDLCRISDFSRMIDRSSIFIDIRFGLFGIVRWRFLLLCCCLLLSRPVSWQKVHMQSAREKDTGEAYTGQQKDAGETSNDRGNAYTRNSPSEVYWAEGRIAWAGQHDPGEAHRIPRDRICLNSSRFSVSQCIRCIFIYIVSSVCSECGPN